MGGYKARAAGPMTLHLSSSISDAFDQLCDQLGTLELAREAEAHWAEHHA